MSAASSYLEKSLLDHVLRYSTAPYTGPSTLYVALFNNTSTTTLSDLQNNALGDEVSATGTAYARQIVTFNASATTGSGVPGAVTSSTTGGAHGTVTFPTATATWGSITHVAIMDSGTYGSGNVLFFGAVTTAKQIDTGDTFQITAGNLTVALA